MYSFIEVQLISLVITVLLLFCNRFGKKVYTDSDSLMDIMLWVNLIKVICYICTLTLEGHAEFELLDSVLTCGKCSLGYPMLVLFTMYIKNTLNDSKHFPVVLEWISYGVGMAGMLINIASIFTPLTFSCEGAVYRRGPLFQLNQILAFILLILIVLIILNCRKKLGNNNAVSLLLYSVIPMISSIAQIFLPPEPDLSNIGITLGLLTVFIIWHVERERIIAEKEKELTDIRVSIMLSQIRPHFLYNTLAVIQGMCHEKAPDAEATTIEFAEYLRGNMDAIGEAKMIPFSQEMRHTELYLSLEQKRFGDALMIRNDILEKDFMIPVLTLQPIVENAVKHGVMRREGGGTVSIYTSRIDKAVEIVVQDDGVGFDVNKIQDDEVSHIGIANVKERLEKMCGGSLSIKSVPRSGTIVTIIIPDK